MNAVVRVLLSMACLLLCAARASAAEVVSGDFRLALGHAMRQSVSFPISAPGTLRVRISQDAGGSPLIVMVLAGRSPVFTTQFTGAAEFTVAVTRDQWLRGQEGTLRVEGTVPDQRASGRMAVTFDSWPSGGAHPLDTWLRARPGIGAHMIWNDGRQSLTYSVWPEAMRRRLWAAYDRVQTGAPSGVTDPAPNALPVPANRAETSAGTALAPDVAEALYLSTVAHSLAVEISHRVPWSLTDLNDDEREALLSSTSMFYWNAELRAYRIEMFDHGWATPAPAEVAWTFLEREHLLRATRYDTIVAVLGWTQQLWHFAGGYSWQNAVDHWGYAGAMPVSRALAGTKYSGTEHAAAPGWDGTHHFTAGCHGTAGLLLNVLRAANIPMRLRGVSNATATHATVIFLSEDRALSHGDDPYSQVTKMASPDRVLIDLETYNAWLGPMALDPGSNIGRRAFEVAQEVRAAMPPAVEDASARGAESWLEAESLAVSVTAGVAEAQPMQGFTSGTWRGGQQVWWHDAPPGARLTLQFSVPSDGVYLLSLALTHAPDYGIVSARVDEVVAVEQINLYGADVVPAALVSLGEHEIKRGAHALTLTVFGKDPRAAGFMVGVDSIQLVRIK